MPHHEVVRHIVVSVAGRCSLLGGQVVHVTHCSSGQWVHVTLLEWSSCPVVKLSTWHTARVVKLSSGQVVHVTLLEWSSCPVVKLSTWHCSNGQVVQWSSCPRDTAQFRAVDTRHTCVLLTIPLHELSLDLRTRRAHEPPVKHRRNFRGGSWPPLFGVGDGPSNLYVHLELGPPFQTKVTPLLSSK